MEWTPLSALNGSSSYKTVGKMQMYIKSVITGLECQAAYLFNLK
jgi:hypothetical protein